MAGNFSPSDIDVFDHVRSTFFEEQFRDAWRQTPRPDPVYFVRSIEDQLGETFATLVPVDPGRRHVELTLRLSEVLRWASEITKCVTPPDLFENGCIYETVTGAATYKVVSQTEAYAVIEKVPPSEFGPDKVSWAQLCSRVARKVEW